MPPYEIRAGNPAKLIRKRFDDQTIEKLLDLQWWTLDDEQLAACGDLFNDVNALIKCLEEHKK